MAGSIVDYLNSKGQDSSYSARAKLAQQYGISNYSGTAAQNTQLLGKLQNSGGLTIPSSGSMPGVSGNITVPKTTSNTTTPPAGSTYNLGQTGNASPGLSAPVINTNSILSAILSGQVDPSQAKSYITNQVKNSYISLLGQTNGTNDFNSSGQQAIDSVLSSLQGQSLNYGGQTYQFGNGGQAIKTTTTNRVSNTNMSGPNAGTGTFTYGTQGGSNVPVAGVQTGGNFDNSSLLKYFSQAQIDTMPDSTKTMLSAMADTLSSAYSKGGATSVEQAYQDALNDPELQTKYGDALKIAQSDFAFNLDQYQQELGQTSLAQKTQFENERKNLAETEASAGRAYSGFREQAKGQLAQSESGIVESTKRTLQKSLRDLGSKFESTFGTSATPSTSLSYSDPLSGASNTYSYTPYGGITGTAELNKKLEAESLAQGNLKYTT